MIKPVFILPFYTWHDQTDVIAAAYLEGDTVVVDDRDEPGDLPARIREWFPGIYVSARGVGPGGLTAAWIDGIGAASIIPRLTHAVLLYPNVKVQPGLSGQLGDDPVVCRNWGRTLWFGMSWPHARRMLETFEMPGVVGKVPPSHAVVSGRGEPRWWVGLGPGRPDPSPGVRIARSPRAHRRPPSEEEL